VFAPYDTAYYGQGSIDEVKVRAFDRVDRTGKDFAKVGQHK